MLRVHAGPGLQRLPDSGATFRLSQQTVRILMKLIWTIVIITAAAPSLVAQSAPRASFAPDRLARIDRFMQDYVDSNRIGGAVGLVMQDGKVVYSKAVGWSDKDAKRPMTIDAMFRIASQSKAITSTAIMMLLEEGKLRLSDPVSKYLPTFARTTVATRSDTGRVIARASRPITIRDLLTHTAGISYGTDAVVAQLYAERGLGPEAGWGWYTADKDEDVCVSMDRLGTLPFVAQPGTQFVYGYNTDILGCIVERISGIGLDRFINTRITAPLKMNDTYFFVPSEKRNRLVEVFMSDSTGHAVRAPNGSRGQGQYADGPRKNFSGGAGIVSTARDYGRFLQMILNGGELDGARILAPHTVDLMTHDQIGTIYPTAGLGWGYGFETVEKLGAGGMKSVGTFGWAGAYGSTYFGDPREHLVVVFMINQLPLNTDIGSKFPTMVYAALMSRHN
jgi:CubicO group peptidase (beta-lactamase class C family)